ncbi:hypothetical protein BD413DRAFT_503657, partial [Trametes elegans]
MKYHSINAQPPPIMEYPDEVLPFLSLSISQLIERASDHLSGGWVDNLIRLMLAGRSCEGEDKVEHRVYVDSTAGFTHARADEVTLTGDFDSLIGVTERLPLNCPLLVFPAPSFQKTLRTSVNITMRAPRGGRQAEVPLHKIANVCFAQFGVRGQVHLLFPHAIQDDDGPMLSQTDLADLYNTGILQAVNDIMPEQRAHWPPSYAAAIDRSRDHAGRLHFSSVDISVSKLDDFAATLIENLQNHPRLKSPHFMVELRGTKGMYTFPVGDTPARAEAFSSIGDLIDWVQESDNLSKWYVDIAIEVSQPGHVLQWKKDAHDRLLSLALPSASDHDIGQLLQGTNYHLDVSGHLFALAGFRANPGTRGREDGVVHINVYTTDNTLTHQLHRGAFRKHIPSDTTPGKIKKLQSDVLAIGAMFARCGGSEGEIQDGTARFEVCVAIEHFENTLQDFPDNVLEHAVICIPSTVWWDFKYCRVVAIHYLLREMADYTPSWRATRPVLQLFAVLVFMLNATLSAPSTHTAEMVLADASAMKIPRPADDDNANEDQDMHPDNVVPIGTSQGLYCVCDIVRDSRSHCWRIPNSHSMNINQLLVLFHSPTLAALTGTMGATGIECHTKGGNKARTRNRRGYTLDVREVNADAVQSLNLALANEDVVMWQPVILSGPDVDGAGEGDVAVQANDLAEDDALLLAPNGDIDYLVDRIWAQFAFDLIQVSPNNINRFEPAYATLSSAERLLVTPDLYRRPAIPFSASWYRFRGDQEWSAIFNRLFPPHGHVSFQVQNYNSCQYYQLWQLLSSQCQQAGFERLRAKLRTVFGSLLWLPDAASDRIWVTRPHADTANNWKRLARDGATQGKGVHIVINRGVWLDQRRPEIRLGNAIAFEDEEAAEQEEEFDDRCLMPPPGQADQHVDGPRRSRPPPGTPAHPASREAAQGGPHEYPPRLPGPTLDSYLNAATPTPTRTQGLAGGRVHALPAALRTRPRNATAGPSRQGQSTPSSTSTNSAQREAKRRRLLREESEGSS